MKFLFKIFLFFIFLFANFNQTFFANEVKTVDFKTSVYQLDDFEAHVANSNCFGFFSVLNNVYNQKLQRKNDNSSDDFVVFGLLPNLYQKNIQKHFYKYISLNNSFSLNQAFLFHEIYPNAP